MTFEEYVRERGQALLRLAGALTGDAHLAQDVVQTALTDACRHWRRVSAARDPDAYVRRMVVNANLSRVRRRSAQERPTILDETAATVPDHADDVAGRDHLRRLLAGLPPRARAVLALRYYADLEDRAIADLMGVAESTVRATAARALAVLREAASTVAVEER